MQEAQSSLLAKDDDLLILKQELSRFKAQQSKSAQSHQHGTQNIEAHAQHRQDAKAPTPHRQGAETGSAEGPVGTAESAQSRPAGESGLPSPSLPASPHSPGGSPKGDRSLLL